MNKFLFVVLCILILSSCERKDDLRSSDCKSIAETKFCVEIYNDFMDDIIKYVIFKKQVREVIVQDSSDSGVFIFNWEHFFRFSDNVFSFLVRKNGSKQLTYFLTFDAGSSWKQISLGEIGVQKATAIKPNGLIYLQGDVLSPDKKLIPVVITSTDYGKTWKRK